jgi:iron complex outermembrane receptor protein
MKTSATNSRRAPTGRGLAFKVRPVAASCALLLLGATDLALAQQAAQEVTVTGIRRGIESAISVKKNAEGVVEAISAEDIGKLPDTSIAESIARLPGVAAQRKDGRASQISIRGMPPDFSTTLLNGREISSTGDSRAAEYDQFPSELVNGVTIFKTPDAGLIGQGLSGTVNIQSVRPLDLGKRTVAVNYRNQKMGVGSVAEGDGYRASLAYVDQFADRTIGVALGFARLDETGGTSTRTDNWGGGSYNTVANVGNNGCTVGTTAGCVNVPYNGFGLFADQLTQKRDGAMAVLQYKPNKNFNSTLDIFYSKFDQVKATKGLQLPLNDSWAGGTYDRPGNLLSPVISGNNVTSGRFDNVRAVVRNDSESTHDKINTIGWNNKLTLANNWTATADLSRSKSTRTGGIVEVYGGTVQNTLGGFAGDTVAFTNAGVFTPALDYTNRNIVKITDVQGWGGGTGSPQAGYSKLPNVKDQADALRFSAKKDLGEGGLLTAVEAGLVYQNREKTRAFIEGRLVVTGDTTGLGSLAMPGSGTLSFLGVTVPTFDPLALVGNGLSVVGKLHPDIFNKDWTVKEKLTTGFVRGDIERELFGFPVRGNVGVQLVHTSQQSNAFNVDRDSSSCQNDQTCPANGTVQGTSYYDVLPSLNLNFDIGNEQVVRVGLARVMARPTINDMRASTGFGYNATEVILKGDSGNPYLKPFRANALDVSYEKYFGTKAYWGIAGFYKDLSSYIIKQNVITDFTGIVTPTTYNPGGNVIGVLNKPINGSGGHISGVELSLSMPFNMLSKSLDGFGTQLSYSNTASSVRPPVAGLATENISTSSISLPGLSKQVAGLTLYFEKWGFGARVATRYRSDFVGEVTDYAGDRRLTYIKSEAITDLQLSYEIQSGPAKGLSLLVQANNLTDAPYVRYRDPALRTETTNEVERKKFGKTYLFGLNYKL